MGKNKQQSLTCKSITSKIKFYEGLFKKGKIKFGGSAWRRLESLREKKILSRLSQSSVFVKNKLKEANSL
tara:strand:+ start:340 stop:549 length:210 start_codon:yes stop_codon:yes gene_type:complete